MTQQRIALTAREMVNMTEAEAEALGEIARIECTSKSALLRRAVIRQFLLPDGAIEQSTTHQNGAQSAPRQQGGAESVKDDRPIAEACAAALSASEAS